MSLAVGRPYAEPQRMKPNPESVLRAVRQLNGRPGECVLVGDSVTDIEAARRAGVRSIGFANKPSKYLMLLEAGAMPSRKMVVDRDRGCAW